MSPAAPARRTQQQRREETIGKLLDATALAIYELGYARTSVQEICTRAGLSQGALFRHFPTRRDVVIATAQRVAEQQVQAFVERFQAVSDGPDIFVECLRLLRSVVRSESNQVWHELVGAARTDAELREAIRPVLRDYHRRTAVTAFATIGGHFPDPEAFQSALRLTIGFLDGDAAANHVNPDPTRDEQTLQVLARVLESFTR